MFGQATVKAKIHSIHATARYAYISNVLFVMHEDMSLPYHAYNLVHM